ncbi:MAG: DUF4349 domain-containing protein [Flavobacteriales bacterium]
MKTNIIPILILAAVSFTSCSNSAYVAGNTYEPYGDVGEMDKMQQGKLAGISKESTFDQSMLVYNASMRIQVKDVDTVMNRLTELAAQEKGYVVSKNNYSMVLRVETSHLESAMQKISTYGKVEGKSISTTDVSADYEDTRIRLDNAEKARNRYLELLAKAENVEAALKVEKELERLNTEIDMLRGRAGKLEHDVRFSTITVQYSEKTKLGVLGYVFVGLWKGVSWLFVRG